MLSGTCSALGGGIHERLGLPTRGTQTIEQNMKAGYRVMVVAPSDAARDVLRKDAAKLIGDLDQGKSIEAGDFFRRAIQSGIHTAELHDIKRQSPTALDGHYLKAVKLFKAGRTTQSDCGVPRTRR
jgi:hypothetical protein